MLFGSMAWEFLFCGGGMILFAIVFKDLVAPYFFFGMVFWWFLGCIVIWSLPMNWGIGLWRGRECIERRFLSFLMEWSR